MNHKPMNLFQEQIEYVAAVTKVLNTLPGVEGPNTDDTILEVRLVDSTGEQFGYWSDEIAPDSWYFQPHTPRKDPSK